MRMPFGPGGGGGGLPFFIMGPGPQWDDRPQPNQIPDIIVPARVNKALEFISMMNMKTMNRAAVSESQIQEIEGQKMTVDEETAHATACNLLTKYFAGQLQPDTWEKIKVDAARKQVETGAGEGRLVICPSCHPARPSRRCSLCNGNGRVLILPAGSSAPGGDDDEPQTDPPSDSTFP